MDKILIEFLGGVVNLEDTINIRNDDEHVYVDTAHGSIILYKSISYEEDETKAREEIQDKALNIRCMLQNAIVEALAGDDAVTIKVSDIVKKYEEL